MEKVESKYESLNRALASLKKAIDDYQKVEKFTEEEKNELSQKSNIYYEDYLVSLRDSLVKRFEFTVELFWKYLKIYLEKVALFQIEAISPKNITRTACKAKLITEEDAEHIFEMLKDRNLTSHIYQEEIAQKIVFHIPGYYRLLEKITDRLNV